VATLDDRFRFRHLERADLAMMHRWLNHGEVLRWYGQEPQTLEAIEAEYEPRIGGATNVLSLIVELDGEPIGYAQRYFTKDHPDYWERQGFPPDTAGIDLFIGEESLQHRGIGPAMLRSLLHQVVFADAGTARCIIDPFPENRIAIRAYEKVGFRHLRTMLPPEHVDPCYLMVLEREEWDAGQARSSERPPTERTASSTSIAAASNTTESKSAVSRSPDS
jgi:RimJ/RimL family protein N-acetyltransferase